MGYRNKQSKLFLWIWIAVICALAVGLTGCRPGGDLPQEDSDFQIHFIDVGQADAALVLCGGKAMLIDGGNAEDSNLIYSYLQKHSISHLDYIVCTHAHEDHVGGLSGALQYASVGTAYAPVTEYDSKVFKNFKSALSKRNAGITVPTVGTQFSLGGASCQILAVNTEKETNNTSIVVRIVYGQTSFLFMADAETAVEKKLLASGFTLKSTVLKVGHHGSDTSSSYAFLREVMPSYAVISVGKNNSYGHPAESVLSRLRDADSALYRTDIHGDILCTSDGKTVEFQLSKNSSADAFGGIGNNSTAQQEYILNTSSKKFHLPTCHHADTIDSDHRQTYHGNRDSLIDDGYEPCKTCDP